MKKQLSIALMTNNYRPMTGGVPISIERLAKGLMEQGHQVTVFAPSYPDWKGEEGAFSEETVFRYHTLLQHFIGGIVLPDPMDLRIEREFQKKNFDIIHVHHPMLIGKTACYLSRKYQIPLFFTYHTRYEQYLKYYTGNVFGYERLMQLYLKGFFKYCSHVFAPTEGMLRYLEEDCSLPEEKVSVLPTGLERAQYAAASPEELQGLRRKYHAENCPLFLTVSRMAKEKNVEFLLRGLAALKQREAQPFQVLFVGEGPDREALEALRNELGLKDVCHFTGQVENERIPLYYQAADAFLFASKTETQGIVLLEAFAGKTPVIALRASGVEDIVTDGKTGLLTEENPDSFARAIGRFLSDTTFRNELSRNAFLESLSFREEMVAAEALRRYNESIVKEKCEGGHGKSVSYSCG